MENLLNVVKPVKTPIRDCTDQWLLKCNGIPACDNINTQVICESEAFIGSNQKEYFIHIIVLIISKRTTRTESGSPIYLCNSVSKETSLTLAFA